MQLAEPFPPPNDVHLTDIGPTHLTISWNQSSINCFTQGNYIITSVGNCGVCPNSSEHTVTVTCTNMPIDGQTCTFIVQTKECGSIVGNRSDPLQVTLRGKSCNNHTAYIYIYKVYILYMQFPTHQYYYPLITHQRIS